MSRNDPQPGQELDVNLVSADKGDVWTGFEWVKPARYEQLRATTMPHLPPIQPVPGEGEHTGYGLEPWDGGYPGHACPPPQAPPAAPSAATPPPEAQPGRLEPLGEPAPAPEYLPRRTLEGRGGYVPATPGTPPYMGSPTQRAAIEEATVYLLDAIDPSPDRGGLRETPQRVSKAWQDWTRGYSMNAADILKVFEDGAEKCDEMVVVRGIPIYSHCEHHLAPIFGTATIGYLPNGRIVGLSKLNRLADMFARRLQVQERMTNQIADALMEHLAPAGCGVVVTARHMCMESRGVMQRSATSTSALRGNFKDDPTVRNEFLSLARTKR